MSKLFEDHDAAGKAFWNIANLYGFSKKEQAFLLAQPFNRVRLSNMNTAKQIPDSDFGLAVAEELSNIHKLLWLLYPHSNRDDPQFKFKTSWFHRKAETLANVSPMEFALASNNQVQALKHIHEQLLTASKSETKIG